MTQHSLYPSWVKMKYTSLGRTKHAIYPCAISGTATPGIEPDFQTRDAGAVPASTCVSDWVNAVRILFANADTFDSFEVYHKAAIDSDPVFIFGAPIGVNGNSGLADVAFSEAVWTFKTPTQGGLKIYFMEQRLPVDVKFPLPIPLNPTVDAPSVFILGATNWITGRNNDFPLLPLYCTTKQNDFYRRKYKL
jgi:hypothetical protein